MRRESSNSLSDVHNFDLSGKFLYFKTSSNWNHSYLDFFGKCTASPTCLPSSSVIPTRFQSNNVVFFNQIKVQRWGRTKNLNEMERNWRKPNHNLWGVVPLFNFYFILFFFVTLGGFRISMETPRSVEKFCLTEI